MLLAEQRTAFSAECVLGSFLLTPRTALLLLDPQPLPAQMQLPQWTFGRPGGLARSGFRNQLQNTVSVSLDDDMDDVAFLSTLEQQRSFREAAKRRRRKISECALTHALTAACMHIIIMADTESARAACVPTPFDKGSTSHIWRMAIRTFSTACLAATSEW